MWNWTSQAGFKFKVTLKDNVKTYVSQSRQSTNPLPVLSGGALVKGSKMLLKIDCPQARKLKCIPVSQNIVDPVSGVVSWNYTVVGEDAGDNDYNDVWFSITFWRRKG